MTKHAQAHNVYTISVFVSLSCVLQIAESFIPHPIPGLRLGLANILTLIALDTLGFGAAFQVALLRTLVSALLIGTLASPAFILSFSAAIVSTTVMGVVYYFFARQKFLRISLVGISIAGALTHNLVQILLAYLLLIRHKGIFVFVPWLCVGAVATGWLSGTIAAATCRTLNKLRHRRKKRFFSFRETSALTASFYVPLDSWMHRLPAGIKLAAVFSGMCLIFVWSSIWLYGAFFFFLICLACTLRIPFPKVFLTIKRSILLVGASFFFPLLFNSGKYIVFKIGFCAITYEGMLLADLFALRMILLIFMSFLLAASTKPQDIAAVLAKAVSPLKVLGISGENIAAVISLSWLSVPYFWAMAVDVIRSAHIKKPSQIGRLIAALSEFIATMYLAAEQNDGIWKEISADISCLPSDRHI